MSKKNVIEFICYEPKIYSAFDRSNIDLSNELRKYDIQTIHVYKGSLGATPNMLYDLENAGIKIEYLPNSQSKLTEFKAIYRLYKKYRPSVTHTHFENSIKFSTSIVASLLRTKHYTHFHSLIYDHTKGDYIKNKGHIKFIILKLYLTFISLFSTKVLVVSKNIQNQIKYFIGKGKNIDVLYNGLNTEFIKADKKSLRDKLGLPQDKILIVNVAAITYIKGIDLAIKAIKVLKDRGYNNLQFCHIGGLRANSSEEDAQVNEDLLQSVKEFGLEDRVKFLGYRFDIIEILQAFDIYIQPSRMEGLGNSTLEAASQHLPCIGTNIGGIPETIIDGTSGYLFEYEDVEGLADAIQKIADMTHEERIKMGERGADMVKQIFDIDTMKQKLINYYTI